MITIFVKYDDGELFQDHLYLIVFLSVLIWCIDLISSPPAQFLLPVPNVAGICSHNVQQTLGLLAHFLPISFYFIMQTSIHKGGVCIKGLFILLVTVLSNENSGYNCL